MFGLRLITVARLRTLLVDADAVRTERWQLQLQLMETRTRLELLTVAKTHADGQIAYWRERAEVFIDQIGLKSGTLSTPAMTPQPEAEPDKMGTVFTALGKSELPASTIPAAATTATARPVVRDVDEAAAREAVADLVART